MNIEDIARRKAELSAELEALETAEDRARQIADYAEDVRREIEAQEWDLRDVIEAIAPEIMQTIAKTANEDQSKPKSKATRSPRQMWRSPASGQVYRGGAHPRWLRDEAHSAGIQADDTSAVTDWARSTFERVAA